MASHHHWDHIGNVAPFRNNVNLVVGPGFTKAYLPGPSTLDDCPVDSPIPMSDYMYAYLSPAGHPFDGIADYIPAGEGK